MPNWIRDDEARTPRPKKFERIRCFTCDKEIFSKQELKRREHAEHEAHYVDKNGTIND